MKKRLVDKNFLQKVMSNEYDYRDVGRNAFGRRGLLSVFVTIRSTAGC